MIKIYRIHISTVTCISIFDSFSWICFANWVIGVIYVERIKSGVELSSKKQNQDEDEKILRTYPLVNIATWIWHEWSVIDWILFCTRLISSLVFKSKINIEVIQSIKISGCWSMDIPSKW